MCCLNLFVSNFRDQGLDGELLLELRISSNRSEKPWHAIQLLRYNWINPAYLPYFRLRYSFHITGIRSPMIMAYTMSSSIRFELQELREAMAVVRNESPLVTYQRLKDSIDRVSNSWSLPITWSNRISNEAVRAVVSKRLTMLAIETTLCMNLLSPFCATDYHSH